MKTTPIYWALTVAAVNCVQQAVSCTNVALVDNTPPFLSSIGQNKIFSLRQNLDNCLQVSTSSFSIYVMVNQPPIRGPIDMMI